MAMDDQKKADDNRDQQAHDPGPEQELGSDDDRHVRG